MPLHCFPLPTSARQQHRSLALPLHRTVTLKACPRASRQPVIMQHQVKACLAWRLPAGDAPPVPFLPILSDDPPQLLLRPCVDQLLGRQPRRRPHAHVQRPRPREAEAALCLVQLQQAGWASESHQGCKKPMLCSTRSWLQNQEATFAGLPTLRGRTPAAVSRTSGARTPEVVVVLCLIWLQTAGKC